MSERTERDLLQHAAALTCVLCDELAECLYDNALGTAAELKQVLAAYVPDDPDQYLEDRWEADDDAD